MVIATVEKFTRSIKLFANRRLFSGESWVSGIIGKWKRERTAGTESGKGNDQHLVINSTCMVIAALFKYNVVQR